MLDFSSYDVDKSVYETRDKEIRAFLDDIGSDPNTFDYIELDGLCRDLMVLSGNFFRPTGFEELCNDYGVSAFSKDITEHAMTDAILAVKNPDAVKKLPKYYPPFNIFLHMATTVLNQRTDPTSLMDEPIVKKIFNVIAALYDVMTSEEPASLTDVIEKSDVSKTLFDSITSDSMLDYFFEHGNAVYITPFGAAVSELKTPSDLAMYVVRFTKNGKYTIAHYGMAKKTTSNTYVVGAVDKKDIPTGKALEISGPHLNARAFPRSYACVDAYQTFIMMHHGKINSEHPLTLAFCTTVSNIFASYDALSAKAPYFSIDMAVPDIIVFLILASLSAKFVLEKCYELG